ncbi:hypothetical protein G5I_14038 [Acromyrmex echinatior]|uniref:Uncharacterized protein n=1 Tax=Acromyrmex echinatior TaxID=103372 RepID=F4X6R9_ACREC|nr:hypothetical protein G5I_14038 [Acromyrmex echinatior]
MSHRNQLMNPGQEMLDDNIEYATERRFSVAYEIRPSHPPSHDFSPPPTPSKRRNVASREFASSTPKLWTRWSYLFIGMPVETSFSISVASQAHHDGLCQQLVQRYRGIMEHEDKGTREDERERERMDMEKSRTVLSIPSRITLSKTACWHEKKRSPTKDDDRITLLLTLQRAIDATKYSELPQILETKTLERDVATAISMGGRLEIRKNIPRKLTRIRKPARRCVNQLGSKEANGGRRWASRITPLRSLRTKIREKREVEKRARESSSNFKIGPSPITDLCSQGDDNLEEKWVLLRLAKLS